MKNYIFSLLLIGGSILGRNSLAQSAHTAQLEQVYESSLIWNGIAVGDDGRAFVCFPHAEGKPAISVAQIRPDNRLVLYPNISWNAWKTGKDAREAFVRVNSLRFGPDGNLWVLDTGQPKAGEPFLVNDGPKLVVIDTRANKVLQTISLGSVVKDKSFLDDFRFNGDHIYITDAGAPALIVWDQATGQGRRVLENDPFTTDKRPMIAEGKIMIKKDGKQEHLHADQLEVSPDGKLLYFQPACGPMYKMETRFLDDASVPAQKLSKQVKLFYNTSTTGGTCIEASGNLYVTDVDKLKIIKITPKGKASTLITDPRLLWADALWIDNTGNLWIPTTQQNRVAGYNDGVSKVKYPVYIYKMKLGLQPVRR